MSVISLDDNNFDAETSKGIVLVDFSAEWCGPCRMMEPVIHEFAEKKSKELKVGKVDIDASPSVTQKFQITSVPTLVLMKEGHAIATFVGLKDLPQLEQLVSSAIASS